MPQGIQVAFWRQQTDMSLESRCDHAPNILYGGVIIEWLPLQKIRNNLSWAVNKHTAQHTSWRIWQHKFSWHWKLLLTATMTPHHHPSGSTLAHKMIIDHGTIFTKDLPHITQISCVVKQLTTINQFLPQSDYYTFTHTAPKSCDVDRKSVV